MITLADLAAVAADLVARRRRTPQRLQVGPDALVALRGAVPPAPEPAPARPMWESWLIGIPIDLVYGFAPMAWQLVYGDDTIIGGTWSRNDTEEAT